MFLFQFILLWITMPSRFVSTSGCSLCNPGSAVPYTLANPDVKVSSMLKPEFLSTFPSPEDLSCFNLATSLLTGCWNSTICKSLHQQVGDVCCGEDKTNTGKLVHQDRYCPSKENRTKCVEFWYPKIQLCVETTPDAATNGRQRTCEATLNNQSCRTCQVGNYGDMKFTCRSESFGLDCTNLQEERWNSIHDNLTVCKDTVSLYRHTPIATSPSRRPGPQPYTHFELKHDESSWSRLGRRVLLKFVVLFLAFFVAVVMAVIRGSANPTRPERSGYRQTQQMQDDYVAHLEMRYLSHSAGEQDNATCTEES